MRGLVVGLSVIAIVGSAGAVRAQQQWSLRVGAAGGLYRVTETGELGSLRPLGITIPTHLTVTCIANADCKRLRIAVTRKDERVEASLHATATKGKAVFAVLRLPALTPADTTFVRLYLDRVSDSTELLRGRVLLPGESTPADAGTAGEEGKDPMIAELLRNTCTPEWDTLKLSSRRDERPDPWYDRDKNLATFYVNALGKVIARPRESIDEDDAVQVIVVLDGLLAPGLSVYRSSPIREPNSLDIVGAGTTLPSGLVTMAEGKPERSCTIDTTLVTDFAPGKSAVEIAAVIPGTPRAEAPAATSGTAADDPKDPKKDAPAKDEKTAKPAPSEAKDRSGLPLTKIGQFEFVTNRLHTGALSFGFIGSAVVDSSFTVARRGDDSVVTASFTGEHQIRGAMLFTPFVWRKRDYQKAQGGWQDVVYPVFGVVLSDIPRHFLTGVSVALGNTVFLHGGLHFGRVERLDPNAGLGVGDVITGSGGRVPTTRRWIARGFAGGSIDVRAAVELLKAAVGTAAGK
jgi:hypothetical protein